MNGALSRRETSTSRLTGFYYRHHEAIVNNGLQPATAAVPLPNPLETI